MRRVCLETTALADAIRGQREVARAMENIEGAGASFATTVLNVFEARVGIERQRSAEARKELVRKLDRLLERVPPVPLDREGAEEAARVQAELHRRGRPAAELDLLVAVATHARGCDAILTRDTAQFRGLGILEVATY